MASFCSFLHLNASFSCFYISKKQSDSQPFHLTASESPANEQLRTANDQLIASDDHLRTANDLLRPFDDHLRTASDQLRASGDHLRTANDLLRVPGEHLKNADSHLKRISD
jgi:hypothetical protein